MLSNIWKHALLHRCGTTEVTSAYVKSTLKTPMQYYSSLSIRFCVQNFRPYFVNIFGKAHRHFEKSLRFKRIFPLKTRWLNHTLIWLRWARYSLFPMCICPHVPQLANILTKIDFNIDFNYKVIKIVSKKRFSMNFEFLYQRQINLYTSWSILNAKKLILPF